jgi:hypothetical protein
MERADRIAIREHDSSPRRRGPDLPRYGITGTNRDRPASTTRWPPYARRHPRGAQARSARLVPFRAPARSATRWPIAGLSWELGNTVYDPTDPMGKMFFNFLATFAEFESDLIKMRTREA